MRGWLLLLVPALAGARVVVTAESAVLVDTREPAALQKAAADLAADLGKVFGKPVRLVNQLGQAGASVVVVCLEANLPPAVERPTGWEVLRIQALQNPWPGGAARQAVVLTGSDLRGAIYAVYHFAQAFLGVDPLYYWTDNEPARRASVAAPDAPVTEGPPAFRYRGWFINDEDLLTGWKPGNSEGTGIALEAWDEIFEALLRLKGNMIVPGTFIFPDEPQVRAASERGLVITQHHIEVLGANTYRWPDDKPYSFAAQPELLLGAWRQAVREYLPGQEVIWTVGYRGRHDRPFWADDQKAASSEAERGRLIGRAIGQQMEIVRRERRGGYFLMNAWMEAAELIRKGALKIPEGVTLVWPDNGHGMLRDEGNIGQGQGVYYHTAMHDSRANQLTERVPLERIQRELGRAARAGATEYLLVNTSDLRPVPLTTRAVMELGWDARPWQDPGQPAVYLSKWCRDEFGVKAADAAAACYRAYFEAPARYGSEEWQTMGDNFYHTYARALLLDGLTGQETPPAVPFPQLKAYDEFTGLLARACREAEPRWKKARELAASALPLVTYSKRPFFQSHVRTQLEIHDHSNRMLALVAEAAREGSDDAKRQKLAAAMESIRAVLKALQTGESEKWAGFYKRDLFVAVRHTLSLALAWHAKLEGRPVPVDIALKPLPVDPYVVLKAYQGARRLKLEPPKPGAGL